MMVIRMSLIILRITQTKGYGERVEFIVGERILKEKIKNKFRLFVENMSGDADHYDITHRDFEVNEADKMEKIIILLQLPWKYLGHNERCTQDNIVKVLEEHGPELGFKYPTDNYGDLVGNDVTYEGNWAALESIKVIYLDSKGDEHFVQIKDYVTEKLHGTLRSTGYVATDIVT